MMDSEGNSLRQDLRIAQENLKAVTKKCRSLMYELEDCAANYDAEKTLRDVQLSRILRALLVLEAQLKQEQKTIRQLLQEKDNVIRAQQLEIAKLRRFTKNYCKVKRECELWEKSAEHKNIDSTNPFDPNQGEFHSQCDYESFLSVSGIQKKYSFADSDVSKASLTSSEITDASNSTTSISTTDNNSSFLNTEGSSDASPDSTLKIDRPTKSSEDTFEDFVGLIGRDRTADDSEIIMENEVNEEREEERNNVVEPIYENICMTEYPQKEEHANDVRDKCNNTIRKRVFKPRSEEQMQDEPNNHWYSDPDEDRANDDVFQNTIYQSNSNHNSVLECVNQILLRDIEDEENKRVTSRRYKYKGKVVCFQTAKLSDIESVGSEVERRNSEDMMDIKTTPEKPHATPPEKPEVDLKLEPTRIVHDANEKTGDLLSEPGEAKALVIIEPKEEKLEETVVASDLEPKFVSCFPRNETKIVEKLASPKRLTIAKNLDYEDIESLTSEVSCEKTPVQKPQFRNNTLILKKIPSPSFLINESKKYKKNSPSLACKTLYEEIPVKKSTFNQLIYCQSLGQHRDDARNQRGRSSEDNCLEISKGAGNLGHFEEFKIEESKIEGSPREKYQELPEVYDVHQNFEEFKLDECDLSDNLSRLEADGSEMQIHAANLVSNPVAESKNNQFNSCYDNFLEASGMSNKSILTPSRLISNHKSMVKLKDIKYKRKIKANGTIYEGQDAPIIGITPMYNIKHWTGPFV